MFNKDFYTELVARINAKKTEFTDAGLSEIKHMDIWANQYNREEDEHPYELPAVFFEIEADWTDQGSNAGAGVVDLKIHVEQHNYANSADKSTNQAKALEVQEIVDRLNVVLHGFSGTNFNKLKRRRSLRDPQLDHRIVYIIEYTTLYTDDDTNICNDLVQSEGDHEVEVEVKLAQPIVEEQRQTKYRIQ